MFRTILLAVLSILTLAGALRADDWPQWRGPNRDGKSAETGLLKRWPKEGPPVAWQSNFAGEGFGAPSIADGKVYAMGNGQKERRREWLVCLDERTGEQLWACMTGDIRTGGGGHPGPRSTPTVAGGRVYCLGLAGRLLCCDAKTGQPFWYIELARDLGGEEPRYGYSESVLVDGDRVVCTPGMQNTVVALDAKTGKRLWAAKAGDRASYSSPVKANFGDTPQYIAFTEKGLVGIRASDGAVLWRYDTPSNGQANIPTPVVLGATVFAASGYGRGGGCAWIQKDASGAFAAKELYSTNKMQNQHGGFVLVDGCLYGCSDPGVLVCLDYKTGIVKKAIRMDRFSIAYADGMLYLRHENGKVSLYEASPTNLVARGSFEQPNRSERKAWPHPVIANGRLYLRDQYLAIAYNIAAKEAKDSKDAKDAKDSKTSPSEKERPKPPAKTPAGPGAKAAD